MYQTYTLRLQMVPLTVERKRNKHRGAVLNQNRVKLTMVHTTLLQYLQPPSAVTAVNLSAVSICFKLPVTLISCVGRDSSLINCLSQ